MCSLPRTESFPDTRSKPRTKTKQAPSTLLMQSKRRVFIGVGMYKPKLPVAGNQISNLILRSAHSVISTTFQRSGETGLRTLLKWPNGNPPVLLSLGNSFLKKLWRRPVGKC